jgi:ElaB/YqjD/DUF883 family membrane-anchored ribosome-binding protein
MFPMDTSAEFKSPEQIAEATREAVRATADGADAYMAGISHDARDDDGTRSARLLDRVKQGSQRWREQGAHFVAERPTQSVAIAAAGGAALSTLMWAALRGSRR